MERYADAPYYLSAYGLAVKNGFCGTEEEWLESLKGPEGPIGRRGPKGETGDKGEKGKDAVIEHTFSPASENAQSGKAVAEATNNLSNAAEGYKSESEKMITFDETDNVSPIPHFFNVRLEKLPKAEDYTEYQVFAYKDSSLQDIMNTVYFYPNEDGTVEGIHSEYRFIGYNCKKGTVGEMCNGSAILHCTYNKDINAVLSGKANTEDVPAKVSELENDSGFITEEDANQNFSNVGKKDGAGAEIFNDYTNNAAPGTLSHAEGASTKAIEYASHAEGDRTKAAGACSHSEGVTTEATGYASHAEGCSTKAIGADSHSEGHFTEAVEEGAHAEGYGTKAEGYASHAEGQSTNAIGKRSHAEGAGTKAIGEGSHSEGDHTKAEGYASHSEGRLTKAVANYSHAEGYETKAEGESSHAEGYGTEAKQTYSHAEGYYTVASGERSHAEGDQTVAEGYASHSEGRFTKAIGMYTHAEGANNEAIGHQSHAEGLNNITKGGNGHIEGNQNRAYGHTPHAEGYKTTALGHGTHAEGASSNKAEDYIFEGDTTAIKSNEDIITEWKTNKFSLVKSEHFTDAADETLTSIDNKQGAGHGEGKDTLSLGYASHAEGRETIAEGDYSHTSGYGTHAKRIAQTVIGQFNEIDEDALFVAGNGTDDEHRSNAMVLKTDGTLLVNSVKGLDGKSLLKEEWQLIEDIILEEAVTEIQIPKEKLQFKEVYIESLIIPNDTTKSSQSVFVKTGGYNLWLATASPKNGKIYGKFRLFISPDNKPACDATLSAYYYTLGGSSFESFGYNFMGDKTFDFVSEIFTTNMIFGTDIENGLGVGTKFKVWGR